MRQKRFILLFGLIIQGCFVLGQEWTDNKIIYVDNTTMESSNPEKVEIEFKWAKCIELNLGTKETVMNGKSYYRFKKNISKTDCTITGKFDYADCNGNITTEPFSKNLDDWMNLDMGNSFEGVKLIKVYDIVMSGCKTPPEKEKKINPDSNNGHTIITNSGQGNTTAVNGFYYFSTINVPTDKGIFQIYTAPLYYDGASPDYNKLKSDALLFNDRKLKEAIKTEGEKILERKLKPQGKKPSADDIEKQTTEILDQIKKTPDENITIWTKTVNINYLAKTESKSKEQMQEVISTMKTTLYGLCGDDTYPNCYRYILLNKEDNNGSGNQLSSIKNDDADNKRKDDISDDQTKKVFDLFFGQGSTTDFSINDEDIKVAKSLLTELINRSCQMAVVEGLQSLDISLISIAESIYTMTSNCNNAKNKGKYYEVIRNAIAVKWKSAFSIRKQTGEW